MKIITKYQCEFETYLDLDRNSLALMSANGATLELTLTQDETWDLWARWITQEDEGEDLLTSFSHYNCGREFALGLKRILFKEYTGITVEVKIPPRLDKAPYTLQEMQVIWDTEGSDDDGSTTTDGVGDQA
jgi:hypothetical protein